MKTVVKQIYGNWDLGYVLDKHMFKSTYIGDDALGHPQFENIRTEVGEATFQLKYRSQWDQAELLATEIHQKLCPSFTKIGIVIPMVASKPRAKQPVTEVARYLAKQLDIVMFDQILIKKPNGQSLKDLQSKEEKVKALAGTITLNDEITNEGKWNALIIDDLYQSGASLEAACAVLRTYAKIGKIYVAALTWK